MANLTVTDELLTAALAGYQAELDRIDVKMGEIRSLLGDGTNHRAVTSDNGRPKRKFTVAARKRMQAAQKRRWEKIKEAAEPPQVGTAKTKKRKMSAAGKAAIIAGVKKRWAAVKAAKQTQKPVVAKKTGRKKTTRKAKTAAKAPEQSAAANA
jgi:hypothetical protein